MFLDVPLDLTKVSLLCVRYCYKTDDLTATAPLSLYFFLNGLNWKNKNNFGNYQNAEIIFIQLPQCPSIQDTMKTLGEKTAYTFQFGFTLHQ